MELSRLYVVQDSLDELMLHLWFFIKHEPISICVFVFLIFDKPDQGAEEQSHVNHVICPYKETLPIQLSIDISGNDLEWEGDCDQGYYHSFCEL